jgi:quercetin dioxygenase-like cupin family protein
MLQSDRRQFLGALGAGAALFLTRNLPVAADTKVAEAARPRFVPAGKANAIWWLPQNRISFLANKADTGGVFGVWLDETPPAFGPPRHVHSLEEEGFYLLEGDAVFHSGDQTFEAKPGTYFNLARGIPHAWEVTPKAPGKLLTLVVPGGHEGFFAELGTPIDKEPPPADKRPEIVEINRIAAKYGVAYFGPSNQPSWGTLRCAAGRTSTMVRPDEGDIFGTLGSLFFVKVGGKHTQKTYTFVEIKLGPQGEMPLHSLEKHDECLYVREGQITVKIGTAMHKAGPGDFLFVPKGTVHGFRNVGEKPARVLVTTAPAGLEDFFAAAGDKIKDASAPVRPAMADDLKKLRSVGERHGVKVVATKLGM